MKKIQKEISVGNNKGKIVITERMGSKEVYNPSSHEKNTFTGKVYDVHFYANNIVVSEFTGILTQSSVEDIINSNESILIDKLKRIDSRLQSELFFEKMKNQGFN